MHWNNVSELFAYEINFYNFQQITFIFQSSQIHNQILNLKKSNMLIIQM